MSEMTITEIDDWIFDLDNTLYPEDSGLWAQVDIRITNWIGMYFSVTEEAALSIRKRYSCFYGTALRGLMTEASVDPNAYMDYIYSIDYGVLQPDIILRDLLAAVPGRKTVFTSSPRSHALQVLEALCLSEQITEVFDIKDAAFNPKPAEQTYDCFLTKLGIDPFRSIMFEDTPNNLDIPLKRGMRTVLISASVERSNHCVQRSVSDFLASCL